MNKTYISAFMVLWTLIVVGGLWLNGRIGACFAVDQDIASQRTLIEQQKEQYGLAEKAWREVEQANRPRQAFLQAWQPQLSLSADPGRLLHRFQESADEDLLTASDKSTDSVPEYPWNEGTIVAQRVSILVSGRYDRIFDWLNRIESEFPIARVESLEFKQIEQTPALRLQAIFPSFPDPS
jgi:hypothetical protein